MKLNKLLYMYQSYSSMLSNLQT